LLGSYPNSNGLLLLRAESFIRRADPADFPQASSDIKKAQLIDQNDFHAYNVEVQLLKAQANIAPTSEASRELLVQARDVMIDARKWLKGTHTAHASQVETELSVLLNDWRSACESAQRGVDTYSQDKAPPWNLMWLLCFSLAHAHEWLRLKTMIQTVKDYNRIPGVLIWIELYLVLANLYAEAERDTMAIAVENLVQALELYKDFDPTKGHDMAKIKLQLGMDDLGSEQRRLAVTLRDYLCGSMLYGEAMDALTRFLRSTQSGATNGGRLAGRRVRNIH
jgi:hypothetical protein